MPGPAQPTTVPWEKREALVAAEEGEVVSWSTKLHLCSSVGVGEARERLAAGDDDLAGAHS